MSIHVKNTLSGEFLDFGMVGGFPLVWSCCCRWDFGQMVLKADLQSLFPSNLDLAVGVLIFSVGVNDRRISEAC